MEEGHVEIQTFGELIRRTLPQLFFEARAELEEYIRANPDLEVDPEANEELEIVSTISFVEEKDSLCQVFENIKEPDGTVNEPIYIQIETDEAIRLINIMRTITSGKPIVPPPSYDYRKILARSRR